MLAQRIGDFHVAVRVVVASPEHAQGIQERIVGANLRPILVDSEGPRVLIEMKNMTLRGGAL